MAYTVYISLTQILRVQVGLFSFPSSWEAPPYLIPVYIFSTSALYSLHPLFSLSLFLSTQLLRWRIYRPYSSFHSSIHLSATMSSEAQPFSLKEVQDIFSLCVSEDGQISMKHYVEGWQALVRYVTYWISDILWSILTSGFINCAKWIIGLYLIVLANKFIPEGCVDMCVHFCLVEDEANVCLRVCNVCVGNKDIS